MYYLLILSIIITISAQLYINSTYNKYSKELAKSGKTAAETARIILDNNGLSNVKVKEVSGFLTDHYDPRKKEVRLSSSNYNSQSISAVSVASHECGHAIQDKENYSFLRIRASLIPLVNFSSYAGYFAILFGILFGSLNLVWLGIIAELVILLFQFITLPVEFNASKRALKEIEKYNILNKNELEACQKVLTSAALTYVASVATTIIEILRLVLIFSDRRD
ncbi:MAG: zinc metallopeptidase [Candidatus Coprovivens sp.]